MLPALCTGLGVVGCSCLGDALALAKKGPRVFLHS